MLLQHGKPEKEYLRSMKVVIDMKFTDKQIEFMREIGIKSNFDNLSDDDYIEIEEKVGDKLQISGFNKNNEITKIGKMCESILDLMND